MEMGKLTAKLRDAVPVCFMVEGKEIKRYKNIEIPDDLKKLEYQDFKFDVPMSGAITFKIMFEPGILPEEWPQARARKMRKPLAQDAQPQEAVPAVDVAAEVELEDATSEVEPQQEIPSQDGQPPEATQAPEGVQANDESIAKPEDAVSAQNPAAKAKGKKDATSKQGTGK